MSKPLQKALDWTVVRNRRELRQFDRENSHFYKTAANGFPCVVKSLIDADENGFGYVLCRNSLIALLAALEPGTIVTQDEGGAQ